MEKSGIGLDQFKHLYINFGNNKFGYPKYRLLYNIKQTLQMTCYFVFRKQKQHKTILLSSKIEKNMAKLLEFAVKKRPMAFLLDYYQRPNYFSG